MLYFTKAPGQGKTGSKNISKKEKR